MLKSKRSTVSMIPKNNIRCLQHQPCPARNGGYKAFACCLTLANVHDIIDFKGRYCASPNSKVLPLSGPPSHLTHKSHPRLTSVESIVHLHWSLIVSPTEVLCKYFALGLLGDLTTASFKHVQLEDTFFKVSSP